jgi:hypothetical protein
MIGIVIAAATMLICHFVLGQSLEAGFLTGVGFAWIWYLVWAILQGIFMLLVALGITGVATAGGASSTNSAFGGLLGFAGGGLLSLFILAIFLAGKALLLGGTWLLKTSGTPDMTFAEFNSTNLIVGGLLVAASFFFKTSASASSSSSSDDGRTIRTSYRRVN